MMMLKLRNSRRSKMMIWSLLLVILGAVTESLHYFQDEIKPQYYGLLVMCIGIVTAILRWNTSKPLEDL